jgi:hypothetical protein
VKSANSFEPQVVTDALGFEDILDGDGNAMQRAEVDAARQLEIGLAGALESAIAHRCLDGVELRVEGIHPSKSFFGQIDGGNLAGPGARLQLAEWSPRSLGSFVIDGMEDHGRLDIMRDASCERTEGCFQGVEGRDDTLDIGNAETGRVRDLFPLFHDDSDSLARRIKTS